MTSVNASSVLETERLTLRRFADCDADAALLLELDSDPEVMRYIGAAALTSVAAYRERIRTWRPYCERPGRGVWAVCERATGGFLGWVMLRDATAHRLAADIGWTLPSELELGYRLKRAAWGRGFATEAAVAVPARLDPEVTAVVAVALVSNRGSTRVMEKVGLAFEREVPLPGFADAGAVYAARRRRLLSEVRGRRSEDRSQRTEQN